MSATAPFKVGQQVRFKSTLKIPGGAGPLRVIRVEMDPDYSSGWKVLVRNLDGSGCWSWWCSGAFSMA